MSEAAKQETVDTEVLISGAGPARLDLLSGSWHELIDEQAGLSLAIFLRALGVRTTLITKHGGTANSHRAHSKSAGYMHIRESD